MPVGLKEEMDEHEYKYDVAFSFLAQDEALATEINDLIQDRFETFIYSERQAELIGTDGAEEFAQVFGSDARIVGVLYREGWGQRGFTLYEDTAIRNRAREEGFGFTIFIPLDVPPTGPKWLPKDRIWHDLPRWGAKGAAAVIEAKVDQAGGLARPEMVEDKAVRMNREREFALKRSCFLQSEDGVQAAQSEFKKVCVEIERKCQTIVDPSTGGRFGVRSDWCNITVSSRRDELFVCWDEAFLNTLDGSHLKILIFSRAIRCREPDREERFSFDVEPSGAFVWREVDADEAALSTVALAEHAIHVLLDHIQEGQADAGRNWSDEHVNEEPETYEW